jgi:hypothetical protein
MKTLSNERDRAELLQRLQHLRPDSVRRWGKMSAHQMVCHCVDAFRMARGEKTVSDASTVFGRTMLKWMVLYLPLRWPPGILTRPELDQEVGGTKPIDFDADIAALKSIVEITATGNVASPVHPLFGRMSQADWLRWGYLHMDHHLRQFGA